MVTKVHGGVKAGSNVVGSLKHFKIETNAATFADGLGSPDKAIELVIEVLQQRGTIVILNAATEFLYVAFENTSCSWTTATIETAIEALSTALSNSVGTDGLNLSNVVVTSPGYVLA